MFPLIMKRRDSGQSGETYFPNPAGMPTVFARALKGTLFSTLQMNVAYKNAHG